RQHGVSGGEQHEVAQPVRSLAAGSQRFGGRGARRDESRPVTKLPVRLIVVHDCKDHTGRCWANLLRARTESCGAGPCTLSPCGLETASMSTRLRTAAS